MIPGLSGSLLSHEALADPRELGAVESDSAPARRRLQAWHAAVAREMGPASSARAVYDRVAVPLFSELGFRLSLTLSDTAGALAAVLHAGDAPAAAVLVTAWGQDPATSWRGSVLLGIGRSVRWCLCVNGPAVRVFDARRTYSRRFAQFDLDSTIGHPVAFAVFWRLLQASAFPGSAPSLLGRAVTISEAHRTAVRSSLQLGVHEALGRLVAAFAQARRRGPLPPAAALLDESLIVLYRVLFLLFAEARGLVPKWHPTYRGSYTVESLRTPIELQARPKGVWETLQAISRLAHRGCRAGALRVAPFNGRLFSPADAPLASSLALDEGAVRDVLLSLTTRADRDGRKRISYGELGVEQLGGVYERILDFEPAWADGKRAVVTLVRAGRRKASGAFYTPRSLTEYIVRRALAPLVRAASPDDILSLRVLDPAMGSGAFLVAACRYLAGAYEAALIRDGVVAPGDVSESERAGFRRAIAQRCLFGVDINPMAVQLGKLSLWLATLSADRPLTFLDHHLRTGNSLSGASLADVARQPPSGRHARTRAGRLPLFDTDAAADALGAAILARESLASDPGDTLDQVRGKERLMASLVRDDAPLARFRRAADLWCAGWFDETRPAGPGRRNAIFGALLDEVLGRGAALPTHVSAPLLDHARAIAARERFFHWTLEFPEVFQQPDGPPRLTPGFDAVIGNPPWEMLRGRRPADEGAGLSDFARASGTYALQGEGHTNLFQLFLERGLTLVRTGGRVGVVLPSGFASDHGCAALRRHLLQRTHVDTFVSIENRDGLFPIHRALRFLLIAATTGASTSVVPCRFGVRSPDVLDELPDLGEDPKAVPVSQSLMAQLSGQQYAVPELRTRVDVAIASAIAFSIPALADPSGWGVSFGRELNATDDRRHFIERRTGASAARRSRPSDYPVIEGKQIGPFTVDVAAARFQVPAAVARTLLDEERTYSRARLAYRDVASSTNRLTLIAAIVPAHVVTTHTLFCLKGNVAEEVQQFLCGVFNSFVANYLVRLRVGTHVTVSIVERLPVPVESPGGAAFDEIVALSRRLAAAPADLHSAAMLQAHVARLYGISRSDFAHILGTFPLIPSEARVSAMAAFDAAE
ncbi:MAG: hypothetical protein V7647_2873 [Acidobacteriota bacterium]